MSLFGLSSLLTSIFSLILGIFVIKKNFASALNRSWFFVSLSASLWAFGLFGVVVSKNQDAALNFQYILDLGGIFIPIFFLLFTFHLLGIYREKKIIFRWFFLFGCLISALSFTPLFKYGVEPQFNFNFWIKPGPLYFLFPLLFSVSVVYTIYLLLKFYKRFQGIKRQQLIYVLFTVLIGFGGGTTNFFPQLIGTYPIGNIFVFFYIFTITYAIAKFRLMDIRLVISKSILYFFLILFVALSFTFVTFSTAQFFEGKGQIWITLAVSLVIVTCLDPLKRLLAKLTDQFFYKGKIEYQDVLRSIGQVIAKEISLVKLLNVLEEYLEKEIKLKKVHVLIKQKDLFQEYKSNNTDHCLSIPKTESIIQYLENSKSLIVTEELPRRRSESKNQDEIKLFSTLEEKLDEINIALAVPILVDNNLTGLFLIENKLSGGAFTQEDLNFFEVLAPQVATALEKAKLFEEVQLAKENLEVLVEQRTADLKERNHYLNALQTLIGLITRSLDFQKVMQTIADGIHQEMNFIGGILSFIDPEKQIIQVGAISDTAVIRQALSLVSKDPKSYFIPLDAKENLAVQAIKEARIISGDNFYDFFKPALTQETCSALQKHLGIKAVVAVPVYAEEKIIGIIDYTLAKPASEITPVEEEMMKSLANQAGIVYRNLTLYQQIQKANTELSSANERLKQLDQAKSEFLSIASHQLRTPLTGIKGYLSMILEGDYGQVSPKILPVIQDVFQASDRLTRLVNIFLNVSRIESGHFEINRKPTDMVLLIEEVIKDLKLSAEHKSLNLIFHKPAKLIPSLSIDPDKTKDVVLNLVDNAIKYTPKGKIEVKIEQIGQAVQVSVKDTGIGMKPGQAQELFKKFVRGEGVAQINTDGSGLGLFIAKKIVEAHGGKVLAESAGEGMGSTFIFTLPIS